LEKRGQIIGPYDMQIAAQAISRDLILVTNNTAEFSRIPHLKITDWV
jgi:tRNA(fMet)-specific endonuclease VapC